jgi:hypothetical protein
MIVDNGCTVTLMRVASVLEAASEAMPVTFIDQFVNAEGHEKTAST